MIQEEYERFLVRLKLGYQLGEDERNVLQYHYYGNIQRLILRYYLPLQLGKYHKGNHYLQSEE